MNADSRSPLTLKALPLPSSPLFAGAGPGAGPAQDQAQDRAQDRAGPGAGPGGPRDPEAPRVRCRRVRMPCGERQKVAPPTLGTCCQWAPMQRPFCASGRFAATGTARIPLASATLSAPSPFGLGASLNAAPEPRGRPAFLFGPISGAPVPTGSEPVQLQAHHLRARDYERRKSFARAHLFQCHHQRGAYSQLRGQLPCPPTDTLCLIHREKRSPTGLDS